MKKTTIIQNFKKQVELVPGQVALTDGKHQMTYEEVDKRSDMLADWLLKRKNVGKDEYVAVIMPSSFERIIVILAVLKTGNGYMPIEPSFPEERIRYMLKEANVKLVITAEDFLYGEWQVLLYDEIEKEAFQKKYMPQPIMAGENAYILYTSGSTGMPKGVVVMQENVINYVSAFQNEFCVGPIDCILQNSVCTFDIFVEEVFSALLSGSSLAIPDEETKGNMDSLLQFMKDTGVTIVSAFPYFMMELNKKELPTSVRLLISGGDVLRKEYISNLVGKVEVYNTYGPTETTVCATYYRCNKECWGNYTGIPIGKAVKGVSVYLLDQEGRAVSTGEIGEICIGGKGVSKGYLNKKEETEKYFVPNPFRSDEIMYRSGDLGMLCEDGNILFIKRKDLQVMIRGKRVEPEEVEHRILESGEIAFASVQPCTNKVGDTYLVAYVTSDKEIDKNKLILYLRRYLPDFMMPKYFVFVPSMPLTLNGKVNRKELPLILE